MKSTASIKGHPVHPMLINFPIAFFTGALVFDLMSLLSDVPDTFIVGEYLVIGGIITSFAAAIPGIIDYRYTVPPDSSAKKRAQKHAFLNTFMLVLFIIAFICRDRLNFTYVIVIEAIAVMLMTAAGWLGGTLVHRNQIGVDPRYANAGKWKEVYLRSSSRPVEVAASGELSLNQMKLLHIDDKRIVLARCEDGYVAFDDHCTHRGGSLAGGAMICGTVQCPWHGSQFDVRTGKVKAGPAGEQIGIYRIEEKGGKIYLGS